MNFKILIIVIFCFSLLCAVPKRQKFRRPRPHTRKNAHVGANLFKVTRPIIRLGNLIAKVIFN